MNSDSHHTYPAAFGRTARAAGVDARVYNLGADGALVSDDYFIADRLAGSADLLVVQLTYTPSTPPGGSPATCGFRSCPRCWASRWTLRWPTRSASPHARLQPEWHGQPHARALLDAFFASTMPWRHSFVGQPLKDALFARWQKITHTRPGSSRRSPAAGQRGLRRSRAVATGTDRPALRGVQPLSHLARDSELRMLDLLCADLQRRHARAVFFLSPLDMEMLVGFGVLDRKQYDANAAAIRAVVERHGLTFIDFKPARAGAAVECVRRHDAHHRRGSALLAQRLYGKLAPLLRGTAVGGGAAAKGGGAAAAPAAALAAPAASPAGAAVIFTEQHTFWACGSRSSCFGSLRAGCGPGSSSSRA